MTLRAWREAAQVQKASESLEKATEDEKKGTLPPSRGFPQICTCRVFLTECDVTCCDLLRPAATCNPSLDPATWAAAQATRLTLLAKTKQAEQQKLRSEGDAAHEAAKSEKAAIEALLAEEGLGRKLEQIAASSGMEDSLLTALPTSMLKPPAERGSFDAMVRRCAGMLMVVAQLQEGLLKRVATLELEIQQGAPAANERRLRVEEATQELEVPLFMLPALVPATMWQAAKVHQEKMSEVYLGMQNALKACQDAKKAAEKEAVALAVASPLGQSFQTFNWGCFEKLRDLSVEKPKAAPDAAKDAEIAAPSETAVATAGA
eukprot:Skav211099  [mRNA]  locus=scaffold2002:421210:430909:- [translate_table: standard]